MYMSLEGAKVTRRKRNRVSQTHTHACTHTHAQTPHHMLMVVRG